MSMRIAVTALILFAAAPGARAFQLQEATIDGLHAAIRSGETTCRQVVEGYLARARAYNGMCTRLVTEDGAKAPKMPGTMRAGCASGSSCAARARCLWSRRPRPKKA